MAASSACQVGSLSAITWLRARERGGGKQQAGACGARVALMCAKRPLRRRGADRASAPCCSPPPRPPRSRRRSPRQSTCRCAPPGPPCGKGRSLGACALRWRRPRRLRRPSRGCAAAVDHPWQLRLDSDGSTGQEGAQTAEARSPRSSDNAAAMARGGDAGFCSIWKCVRLPHRWQTARLFWSGAARERRRSAGRPAALRSDQGRAAVWYVRLQGAALMLQRHGTRAHVRIESIDHACTLADGLILGGAAHLLGFRRRHWSRLVGLPAPARARARLGRCLLPLRE
jgi:hypothetical protein